MDNLKSIQKQLNEVGQMVDRWMAMGYTPSIEKRIVLSSLERVYEQLMDPVGCSGGYVGEDLEPEMEVELIISDEAAQEETVEDEAVEEEAIEEEAIEEEEQTQDSDPCEDEVSEQEESVEEVEEEPIEEPKEEPIEEVEEESVEEVKEESVEEVEEEPIEEPKEESVEEVEEKPIEETKEEPKQEIEEPKIQILNSRIEIQKITDLINTLFWRDQTFFENELKKFENLETLEDALIYISEKYTWNPTNSLAIEFIDILETYYNTK